MKSTGLPLAAQTYTVCKYFKTAADVAMALKKIRAMGYEAVQTGGNEPVTARELKTMLDNEGLTLCSTHLLFSRLEKELDSVIEENLLWGSRSVVVAVLPPELESLRSRQGFERFMAASVPIAAKLKAAGLQLCYHNHPFEFERFADGKTGMDILFWENRNPLLLAELDTYWVQYGGGDVVDWIRRLAGRLPLLHFKDMGIQGRQPVMTEIGDGNLNWPAILAAAKKSGTEWFIVERDRGLREPFESLQISLENIRKMDIP
jgi:sugar phosphate isomerase/epimerase